MSNRTRICYNCGKKFSKLIFIKVPTEEAYAFVCENCNSIFEKRSGYRYQGVWQGRNDDNEEEED